ncbi:hypothetical protein [Myroides odoratus]|uniref:hypothetical protein n=1 Tax=Myroides odoratus TaxID=256 RepID=UPI003342AF0C
MRRLTIKNIGPIHSVYLDLKRINVLIGLQSSGKSTINKIACYCSWVEKEIYINQTAESFERASYFENQLVEFHKLEGFMSLDSFIEFETDFIHFSYTKKENKFFFEWKLDSVHLQYKRTKTLYIPAERNIVAAIPNWFDIKLDNSNLRSFMSDWQEARNLYSKSSFPILDLGITYTYNQELDKDELTLQSTNKKINFRNASSGLQSLIPLYTLIKYSTVDIFTKHEKNDFFDTITKTKNIAHEYRLYENYIKNKISKDLDIDFIKTQVSNKLLTSKKKTELNDFEDVIKTEIENEIRSEIIKIISLNDFTSYINNQFAHTANNNTNADSEELNIAYQTLFVQQSSIFLEEPEVNLFPTTQRELVKYLIKSAYHNEEERMHSLFLTTHSPYILTTLNNLIYAHDCAKNSEEVKEIISGDHWVNFDDVGVWFVKNGTIECILDQEERQIDATKIDEVSQLLNDEFDNLLNTQYHEV